MEQKTRNENVTKHAISYQKQLDSKINLKKKK